MKNYEKQAKDFCKKNGVEFKAEFLFYGHYFPDDKEKRDVYEITLKRNGKVWTFKFGQSISNSNKNRKAPTAYDVLACIQKSEVGTHKDFCSDFGYDEDSRKGFDIYLKVREEYRNCKKLFGDIMEELQEIQ